MCIWRRRSEHHTGAQVVLSLLAAHTATARESGLERHTVPSFHTGDRLADVVDRTAGFVAHDERLLGGDDRVADPAFSPEVYVAAAGADIVNADDYIGRFRDLGDVMVGDFGGQGALQPNRGVLEGLCELDLSWGVGIDDLILPLMLPC